MVGCRMKTLIFLFFLKCDSLSGISFKFYHMFIYHSKKMTMLLNILLDVTHLCFLGPTFSIIIIKLLRILYRILGIPIHTVELGRSEELLF